MQNLPWQPLYSVLRSGRPEMTVYGIVSVVAGSKDGSVRQLLAQGDVEYLMWTRSLLKPWQLMSHLQMLRDSYPQLKDEHIALMMASHNAEHHHLKLLEEIMAIGGVDEDSLRCPKAYPQVAEDRFRLKSEGKPQRRLYHNCSGKHLGYVLSLKARKGQSASNENYLLDTNVEFAELKELLATLLGRSSASFIHTTDGCQLPNFALSALEMAALYRILLNDADGSIDSILSQQCLILGALMNKFPQILGGKDRVDSKLMSGVLLPTTSVKIVAKDGADGLLGVGVGPCDEHPYGLGILIKVAHGYDKKEMEHILQYLLQQLHLLQGENEADATTDVRTDHITREFHFNVALASGRGISERVPVEAS